MKIKKVWAMSMYAALIALALTGCEGLLDPSEPGNLVPKTVVEDSSIPAIELNGSRFHD